MAVMVPGRCSRFSIAVPYETPACLIDYANWSGLSPLLLQSATKWCVAANAVMCQRQTLATAAEDDCRTGRRLDGKANGSAPIPRQRAYLALLSSWERFVLVLARKF